MFRRKTYWVGITRTGLVYPVLCDGESAPVFAILSILRIYGMGAEAFSFCQRISKDDYVSLKEVYHAGKFIGVHTKPGSGN